MEYRVYLSSTLKDLESERRAIQDALADQCVVAHSYTASEEELVASCLSDIERCDVYILVLGLRYGHVPEGPFENPQKLSITELEYRHAGTKKVPRLVFLKDEGVIPVAATDLRTKEHPPERIDAFRTLAGREQRPCVFTDIHQLRERLVKDFNTFKETRDRNYRPNKRADPPQSSEELREGYVDWLRTDCQKVVLLGLNARERQTARLGEVYVPALTVLEMKKHVDQPVSLHYEPLLHRLGQQSFYLRGSPGSGKSTFCKWSALASANNGIPSLSIPGAFQEQMPEGLRNRFPFLCQLRQWANDAPWLAGNGEWTRAQLERSFANWVDETNPGGLTGAAFLDALEQRDCLLILDGVDEVPERLGSYYPRRNLLMGLADALPQWTERHRVLLTSRSYGIDDTERQRLGLTEVDLALLPGALQNLFVHRWYAAANAHDAEIKARGLIEHLNERSDLDDLRPNPMLLTALCVKYDEDLRLPGDIYRLYDAVTDQVLYKRFNTESERDLARLRLSAVALAMHQGLSGRQRVTPEAEISIDEVDEVLIELAKTDKTSERAGIEAVERRESLLSCSGLFLPRPNKRAGFYHLSFQDFLAAVRLRRVSDDAKKIVAARKSIPEWRQALRFLFCAIADQQSPEQALDTYSILVNDLDLDRLAADASPALLFADCLEVGNARGWNLGEFTKLYRQACENSLTRVPPPDRAHLWRVLGRIGLDDRPGVGVRDGLPDIAWIDIPEGPFKFGEDRSTITLPAFRIARYPITNAQFDLFVADGGFEQAEWWRWPQYRTRANRAGFPYPNHPRDSVSWFAAMAFCSWLESRLRRRGKLPSGHMIRLPTSQQWEKAARGLDGREYPWGDVYESDRANINENWSGQVGPFDLKQTSAVGIYPAGVSPYGVLDMAGNVWEWCEDRWEPPANGRDISRLLRGGSWMYGRDWGPRVASRRGGISECLFSEFGFRVACVSSVR